MVDEASLIDRALDRVQQVACGLRGHDSLLQFEQDRMFLRCQTCGHETPGWDLNEVPPTPTRPTGDERPRLVNIRRIA
jgi:hypothetical protein